MSLAFWINIGKLDEIFKNWVTYIGLFAKIGSRVLVFDSALANINCLRNNGT